MTLADPFAPAPNPGAAHDYSDGPLIEDIGTDTGSIKVQVTPVVQSAELGSKVTVTFKGGSGYDAPWIVVHANDLADAHDQVSGDNAATLASLMTQVQKAGGHFAGLYPTKAPVPAGTGSVAPAAASPSAPPPGATGAPSGETRQCQHGEMQFRSGVGKSNGKVWQAFMCPTPKGTPGQCEAEWIR